MDQDSKPSRKKHSEEKAYHDEPLDTARVSEGKKSRKETKRHPREFFHYFGSNQQMIVTTILLVIGLILVLFSNALLGQLIIGLVVGYFFSQEIIYFMQNLAPLLGSHDRLRYIVLAALALALFVGSPGVIIGAILVAAIKEVLKKK